MRKILLVAALSAPLFASAANSLTDGSFEAGTWGLTNASYITYGVATGAGVVPADSATPNLGGDAVGTKAVYMSLDAGTATISNTFVATSGSYFYGYDTYAPANGYANPNDSTFSVTIDGNLLSPTLSVASLTSATWATKAYGPLTLAATAGNVHTIAFTFTGGAVFAKDLVIDKAYVVAVPEPETYALMLAGLAAVGFVARRRNRA